MFCCRLSVILVVSFAFSFPAMGSFIGLRSCAVRICTEVSFQTFALNCCFTETLSEIVLTSVTSAMSSITDDGDDHLLIIFVVSEDFFKSF